MSPSPRLPTGHLVARPNAAGELIYEAKWRHDGKQLKRRIGLAWLDPDGAGDWRPRKGRVPDGFFDEKRAIVEMAAIIERHATRTTAEIERERRERERPATFREVTVAWLEWLEEVKGVKPSTLRGYRSMLAEPGTPYKRGGGVTVGRIMKAFGDRPASDVTTSEVSAFLRGLDRTNVSPRTVNTHRQLLSAVFQWATREDAFGLPTNPARGTDKRREPPAAVLDFFEPDEVEQLARAAADGLHRGPAHGRGGKVMDLSADEIAARCADDAQDAELFRVLAYTGIRIGEAIALRWGDIDLEGRRVIVQRAVSAQQEGPTKAWQVRYVPLADPPHDALQRLLSRDDFTQRDDYVFCNRLGGRLDDSAIRQRYHRARKAAGLRHVKLHGLRHGAGSLVARESDAVFVQHFLGHSRLATTERYMHAKARKEDVARLNRAFGVTTSDTTADAD